MSDAMADVMIVMGVVALWCVWMAIDSITKHMDERNER